MVSKFSHEMAYRGEDLVQKLAKVSITVAGVGALGSNLVDSLCRQGATKLRAIDMDRVEAHNVNNQIYGEDDIGRLKADALKGKMFRALRVQIEVFNKELTSKNANKFLGGSDLVVDAFDNREARMITQAFCRSNNIPCLHAGLFEGYGEVVWDEDYKVPQNVEGPDVCEYPLARNIVMLTVTVAAEEILDFCLKDEPRLKSWAITLRDLSIRSHH
jgi:molybdopterin-synthase adenylyltransferase